MHKRTQKWTVGIIIAVICITLIGSSFIAIFQPEANQTAEIQNQQVLENEYKERKLVVEALNAKLEQDKENPETLLALGDAYYEKSRVTVQLNLKEYKEDLQKAIELYQKVLGKKEDSSVRLKLATSAFFLGEPELADQTYQSILQKEPENIDALYSYGMFLFYEKGDHQQAEANWQKALAITTDEQLKKSLKEMIALAQGIKTNAGEQKDNK